MSDADEFERLILALQGTVAPSIPAHEGSSGRFDRWLHVLAERGGSDLLLVAGAPPSIRVDGRVHPAGRTARSTASTSKKRCCRRCRRTRGSNIATPTSPTRRSASRASGGFRINLHHERGRAAAAVRMLPSRVPRLSTLGLPPGVEQLASLPRGLVHHRRANRLGKDDDPRGDRRRDQPARRAPRRHDRGPDRVRARPPREHHRAGRDRRRCAGLPDGAARRAAAGAGRDRDRRDARPGDDADCARAPRRRGTWC